MVHLSWPKLATLGRSNWTCLPGSIWIAVGLQSSGPTVFSISLAPQHRQTAKHANAADKIALFSNNALDIKMTKLAAAAGLFGHSYTSYFLQCQVTSSFGHWSDSEFWSSVFKVYILSMYRAHMLIRAKASHTLAADTILSPIKINSKARLLFNPPYTPIKPVTNTQHPPQIPWPV